MKIISTFDDFSMKANFKFKPDGSQEILNYVITVNSDELSDDGKKSSPKKPKFYSGSA